MKNPTKLLMRLPEKVSDLNWRLLLFILPPLCLLLYVSISSVSSPTSFSSVLRPFSTFTPFRSIFLRNSSGQIVHPLSSAESDRRKAELERSRIAVCLVGGARRFELTGPSIVQNILEVYPNADVFVHSPLDSNAYKLSLLKNAPRIAAVKIFEPKPIPVTESQLRVLQASTSPNGVQGLLQYFNLVEGCLDLIYDHQRAKNFTYDWVIRTRLDGYWSGPLGPYSFVAGRYVVPSGSSFGGLNDRLGIGDLNASVVALSRLSLLPVLDSAGFQQLNSEAAFKAQLTTREVPYVEATGLPFCIMSDRQYEYPPGYFGVPVASLSSRGPLNGAKCRPCKPVCSGECVGRIMNGLHKRWSWTEWSDDGLRLCDAHDGWEDGWEEIFDQVAGKKLADERKRMTGLKMENCLFDFETMRNRTTTTHWEAPPTAEICRLGLESA